MSKISKLIDDAKSAGLRVWSGESGVVFISRTKASDIVAVWPNGWCSNQSVPRLADQVMFRTDVARKILKLGA